MGDEAAAQGQPQEAQAAHSAQSVDAVEATPSASQEGRESSHPHTQQIDISSLPTRAARRRAASAMLREGEPVFGFHNRPADAPTLGGNSGAYPALEAPAVTGQHAAVANGIRN